MGKRFFIAAIAVAVFFGALAHEYVLIASKFRVSKGDTLLLHLFVADGFNIEMERPLQESITRKFELINENGRIDLSVGQTDGAWPVLSRRVDFEGLGLIQMERDYAKITLDNKKFLSYLKEDHIENIDIKKGGAGQQRERYSRYIKCLVQSGNLKKDTLYKTITGQAFEIVLLQNPYALKPGATLSAKVYFMGKPLAGKIITARNRTGGEAATKQTSKTNANGICRFTINRKGDWFIHATQMIACPEPLEADWESFWASYSFGIE